MVEKSRRYSHEKKLKIFIALVICILVGTFSISLL